MFSITSVLIGLAMVGVGVAFVKWTFKIANLTGRQDWIEHIAGSGMTFGVYKILGVVLVLIGLLVATGFGNNVMNFIFAPLLKVFTPPTA